MVDKKIERKREVSRIALMCASLGLFLYTVGILCTPEIKVPLNLLDLYEGSLYIIYNLSWAMIGWLVLCFVAGCIFYLAVSEMKIIRRFKEKIMVLESEKERLEESIAEFEKTAHKSQSSDKKKSVGDSK